MADTIEFLTPDVILPLQSYFPAAGAKRHGEFPGCQIGLEGPNDVLKSNPVTPLAATSARCVSCQQRRTRQKLLPQACAGTGGGMAMS